MIQRIKYQDIRGPEDFAAAFDVSRETLDRLMIYEALLKRWQKAVNLVAPSTLDAVWHRHFADSAQLLRLAPRAQTWVDLGSGAGFPGMVIAILQAEKAEHARNAAHIDPWFGVPSPLAGEGQGRGDIPTSAVRLPPTPNPSPQGGGESGRASEERQAEQGGRPSVQASPGQPRVTLIEADSRKCAFLREVARQVGISVDILSKRIEQATTQTSLQPEAVCARALAPLGRLLDLAAPLFTARTVGLFLKGKEAAAEVQEAERDWKFAVELVPSITAREGRIAVIRHLEPKTKE